MRIARVVTICAALISTMVGAETERSRRRSPPKSHLSPPRLENISTTPITFTTLRPELRSFSSQIDASVHPLPRRRPGVRGSRYATIRQRESHRPNRHRRQLHRRDKKSRLGRSFDTGDVEKSVHGPRVQEEIHIEPIYRVSRNKSILDSIVDVIRRLIGTGRALGPLVGPFHFPGVGDKVYVRLLEPVLPDHLVIRFVSRSPVTKVESPLDISLPVANHPEPFVLSANELLGKHSAAASDASLSSSNKIQASKPSGLNKLLGSWGDIPKTHNIRNLTYPSKNAVDWNFEIKDSQLNGYSIDQVYRPKDLHPFNASDFQAGNPLVRDYNDQLRFENQFASESPPKYSLDFVSKKMRYLNLDGSVSDKQNDDGFKPMEGPKGVRLVRKIHVRKEVGTDAEKDQKDAKTKSDAFSEVGRKIDDNISNVFRNNTRSNDRKEYFPDFGQRLKNESTESGNIKPVLIEQSKNSTDSRTM